MYRAYKTIFTAVLLLSYIKYVILKRKYKNKTNIFDILLKVSDFGSPELKKSCLQRRVCLSVYSLYVPLERIQLIYTKFAKNIKTILGNYRCTQPPAHNVQEENSEAAGRTRAGGARPKS